MISIRCRIKDYIQPFERTLALRELTAIAAAIPRPLCTDTRQGKDFVVTTTTSAHTLADTLAYWEVVSANSVETRTRQSIRESTVNAARVGTDLDELRKILDAESEAPLPSRRCLRYGTHGIHEYRGKFFPQLVRSLINISGTRPGGLISDPMSGSGTTIVEAATFGCRGIGLDMNPLSTYLGQTKCELLSADTAKLEAAYRNVQDSLLVRRSRKLATGYVSKLPHADRHYLARWFSEATLSALDEVATLISSVSYAPARNLMWISLSNILRSVSWQKNDDLRVRKEIRPDSEIDPKGAFLEELARSVHAVLAFLYRERAENVPRHSIVTGDARRCAQIWYRHKGKVDAVITSPPYATALPYLDTDRLSLCFLGLLGRPDHRARDQQMIGNREVTERERRNYWTRFERDEALLPTSAARLIRRIDRLNYGTNAGFRRRNLPALLAKYFFDMRDVLKGAKEVLRPGAHAFVVVGSNHTVAGGIRIDIDTPNLLAEIADEVGFSVQPSLAMDMLVSRDIFRKNAGSNEQILFLRNGD